MSHLGDFNFDNYTPSPEFDVSALRPSEISAKGLKIFYIGILIYSLIAIVTCIGQIVSYNSCSTWNSGAQAGAEFFYVFSFFTLIGSTVVLGMSVYALIYKMGFSQQLQKHWNTLKKSGSKSNLMEMEPTSQELNFDHDMPNPYPGVEY